MDLFWICLAVGAGGCIALPLLAGRDHGDGGGRTWPRARILDEGRTGYADLGSLPDGTIFCLYENGPEHYDDQISLARFNNEWVEATAE